MTGEEVKIRGTGEGLAITLGEGPLDSVLGEMRTRLESKASFFLGGRVALRVGDRALSAEQLQAIGDMLHEVGVTLWAVESSHPITRAATLQLGLETGLRSVAPAVPAPEQTLHEEELGIAVRRTLRSGQTIRHAGHITLIGDVNAGAEVVAAGDIVVWGKLRGTVHAGAMGNEEAIICALQLAPSQIRIGSHIARPPERGRSPLVPEMARMHEGRIVVERWNPHGKARLRLGDWKLELGGWQWSLRALLGGR